jgi:hypothetical protein
VHSRGPALGHRPCGHLQQLQQQQQDQEPQTQEQEQEQLQKTEQGSGTAALHQQLRHKLQALQDLLSMAAAEQQQL